MNKNTFCLILAGGVGNRLWPISNSACPKQFSDLFHTGKSLIRQTFERINQLIPSDNIYVITGEHYSAITQEQLPEIPLENIIKEPFRKNTAVSIMYAAAKMRKIANDSTMLIIPSDHFITNDIAYLSDIKEGIEYIEQQGGLLTVGIKPVRVETQYGYIQIKENGNVHKISEVKTFTEKPDREIAQKFFESGDFLWNTGVFIWKAEEIIQEMKKYVYDLYILFEDDKLLNTEKESKFITEVYSECPNLSIDFGVLEKSSRVYVLKGSFGWSDTSTWHALHEVSDKDEHLNVTNIPSVIFESASNCIVNVPEGKKVVVCGVENIIVAEKRDYIMVCNKEYEDQVKVFEKKFVIRDIIEKEN